MILDCSGCAPVDSSTSADAPGYLVVTSTWGGTMSGSCATGIRKSAKSPPSVMTIEMTIASRGRSMNTDEIMFSAPAGDGRRGRGRYRCVRPCPLEALHDNLLSLLQAVGNAGRLRRQLAEAHAALPGDVVIVHDVNVTAFLIGKDCGARDRDHLLCLDRFKENGDELVGDQLAKVDASCRLRPKHWIWND